MVNSWARSKLPWQNVDGHAAMAQLKTEGVHQLVSEVDDSIVLTEEDLLISM